MCTNGFACVDRCFTNGLHVDNTSIYLGGLLDLPIDTGILILVSIGNSLVEYSIFPFLS